MACTPRDLTLTQPSSPADPQTYVAVADFARRLLTSALAIASPVEQRFRLAGIDVAVRFSDPTLASAYAQRLAPVLDGNDTDADHQLVVAHARDLAWPVAPQWPDEHCPPPRFRDLLAGQPLKIAYPFSRRLWQIYDPVTRRGLQLTASHEDLPPWDAGAPLRQHVHWLLAEHGFRLTHAATLGRNGRGVLIVGNGGAGKSGTTLAGIAAGMSTCGDDYVAVSVENEPTAHLLFRVIKQDGAGLSRIVGLRARTDGLATNWQGKIELDPETFFPGCLSERLAIVAVVLPFIAHRAVARITRVSAGEIMRAMIRSNLCQFPGEDDDGLSFFSRLLARLPCFRIELAADPTENSKAIDQLLEEAGPCSRS